MTKNADERRAASTGGLCVVECSEEDGETARERTLPIYDATVFDCIRRTKDDRL